LGKVSLQFIPKLNAFGPHSKDTDVLKYVVLVGILSVGTYGGSLVHSGSSVLFVMVV